MPIHRLQLPINCHEQSPNPALVSSNALGHVESTVPRPRRMTQCALQGLGPCRRSFSQRNAGRTTPSRFLKHHAVTQRSLAGRWLPPCILGSLHRRQRPFSRSDAPSRRGGVHKKKKVRTPGDALCSVNSGSFIVQGEFQWESTRRTPHQWLHTFLLVTFVLKRVCFFWDLALSRFGSTGLSHCV